MHIFANGDYLKMFGFKDVDELLGLPLLDLMDANFADEYKTKIKAFPNGEADVAFAFCGKDVNGEPVQGEMSLSSAEYEGEACTQVLVRNQTIAPAADAAEAAQPANSHSPSGSPWGLEDFISALDATSEAINAVLVIEIDHFDALEAEQGLLYGNQIVSEVQAQMLLEAQQEAQDTVLHRIGHCRFALAAPGTSQAGMDAVAERLREFVESALFEVNGKTIRCTVTVGGVERKENVDLQSAIDLAFNTLREQRNGGAGNAISWYKPAEAKTSQARANGLNDDQQRILELVNVAVEESRFMVLFQPIISLRGDSDEHYEVFLRLLDENGKQLAPQQFLDLAIKNGVAGKIDRWVILQSIKLLSVHRSKGHNTRLTINLTSNSLTDEEFIQWLGVAIKAARLPSDAVVFQIAEPDAVNYVRQAREFISGLKKMHIRTSMRHFGVTDQSFETLRHIPVEFVKLDGKHAREVNDDPERKDQLTGMIEELQAQGKMTIVPMVESATVLSALWQAGANFIQGHYLQEPTTEMNYDFSADDT
jgi:EAL domain-containing protein (putative c-di-GMP-specific phosphodiesterase class I)/GGDEF domain-containing protein